MDVNCGTGYKYSVMYLAVFFLAWQKWKCVAFLHNEDTTSHRKVVIHVPLQIKHVTRTVVKVIEKPVVKEFKHDGEIIHHHRHSGHIEHDHSHNIHGPMSRRRHQRRKNENEIAYPVDDDDDSDSPFRHQRSRPEQASRRVNSTAFSERNTRIIRGEAPKKHPTIASYRHRPSSSWPPTKLDDGIVPGIQSQHQRRHQFHLQRPNNFRSTAANDKANTSYSQNGRSSYLRVLFRQSVDE